MKKQKGEVFIAVLFVLSVTYAFVTALHGSSGGTNDSNHDQNMYTTEDK